MERAANLVAVSYSGDESDLGGWDAVLSAMEQDAYWVAVLGRAHAIESKNTLLRSENDGLELVDLGLENILAIGMPDIVLIDHKDHTQNVKQVVIMLKGTSKSCTTLPMALGYD